MPSPTDAETGSVAEPAAVALPSSLAASFDELQHRVADSIGVALAPVGDPVAVFTRGPWTTGAAWSTIKVPLSLALLRRQATPGAFTATMRAAITVSDNGAAQAMWDQLGAHQSAADKVGAILAEAGDTSTRVEPEVTRAGFTAFGQTRWPLLRQAQFAAHAACDPRNTAVLDLMGEISAGQRWGLGSIANVKFKGGWGPDTDGRYLVRQFGILPTANGQVAVAIAADAGEFGEGTAVLSQIASWLGEHLPDLPAGPCRNS